MLKLHWQSVICCQRSKSAIVAIYLQRNNYYSRSCIKLDTKDDFDRRSLFIKRCLAQKIPYPTSKNEPELAFTQSIVTRRISPFGWLLLLIPITTFGLGCWQWKRKLWKEQLIENIHKLTKMPPMSLPENLEALYGKEYYPIRVCGQFLHNREVFIGPRSLLRPEGGEMAGSLLSSRELSNGYWVITPFQLNNRDEIILINRGWVPRMGMDPAARSAGQVTEVVEIVGILRKSEETPQFAAQQQGNIFLCRDLAKICHVTGAKPIFLDATYHSSISGGPIGGQTKLAIKNDHLSYMITWYGLSIGTLMLWLRVLRKGRPL